MKRLLLDATLIVAVVGRSNVRSERALLDTGWAKLHWSSALRFPLRWELAPRAPRLSVAFAFPFHRATNENVPEGPVYRSSFLDKRSA